MFRPRSEKIKTPDEMAAIAMRVQAEGKKVVHCHGVFDLVHLGHVNYFEQSRKLADILYVGILADRFVQKGPDRPRFSERQRIEWVAALESVDFVVLNEEEGPWSLIRRVRPDIYTKGEGERAKLTDPMSKIKMDVEAIESVGGHLVFTPELPVHSSDLFEMFLKNNIRQ